MGDIDLDATGVVAEEEDDEDEEEKKDWKYQLLCRVQPQPENKSRKKFIILHQTQHNIV